MQSTGDTFPYTSPQAFGAAITDRLKKTSGDSPYSTSQRRRQFAYDRLLARLFAGDEDCWILKGGVALLARLSSARHSADVDVVARAGSPEAGFAALCTTAEADLGDYFTFRFDRPRSLIQGVAGIRVGVEAWLGPRRFERFGVDLVTGGIITGHPEVSPPALSLDIPGLVRPPYRLYPLVDTVADKVMAMLEVRDGRPSTRFRDLVDLVLIARSRSLQAEALRRAFTSEAHRRELLHGAELHAPDEAMWAVGYATVVADFPWIAERSLGEALLVAKALVDPVLSRQVTSGAWDPLRLAWT
ncbi:nucleotidyl transferase AbiEii/AbiGii toxin family protein [Microbispora sp. H10836]|uniref:nucleotidyl transferase AbiEii/AbiGii toxin family protein n=1 Tax=Microbispora sp. H10836 TaxID=2729106 RepID=UPI001472CFED|nr:nucleotidyl transferase AbiEii/AbiGii toxin family protein [Microbispora sp. H10836]